MDFLFCSRRNFVQFMCFWVWLCFVSLESSLTASQSTGLKWLSHPTSQTVEAGSSVSFTCSADYSKKIQLYEWEHNNLSLPKDGRYTLKNDGQTLEISQTKLEDRGEYRCVAIRKGKVLGKSQNAALNVKGICDAVQLSIKPSGNTFLTGTNLQLRCKCFMYPIGNYTFTKDGVPVVLGGRISLSRNKLLIDNATEGDSGKYSCKAALNETSSQSSPAPLSVTVVVGKRPQFQVPPPAEVIVLERSLRLIPCKAIGSPKPDVNWYAADDQSPLQDNAKYTIYQNGSLLIRNIKQPDALKYTCAASNLAGKAKAESAVKIAYLDAVVLEKTKLYILLNHETEVYCKKPSGLPEPTITWQKGDGQPLPKKFGVEGCCTLKKNRTKQIDSGNYTCIAKNMAGTESRTVEIIVSGSSLTASQSTGLKWVTQPTPKTVEAGSSVSFTCSADYSEEIQLYEWEHNNLSLPANDDPRYTLKNDGQTLEISQTKLEDRGDYRCVATREGEVLGRSQNAALNVKVYLSPTFDLRPKNTTAFVNDNLWLHCNATGNPKPKICWGRFERIGERLDRSRFIPYHNGTLHIKRLRLDDRDSYFCLAANRAGMKVTMFSLVVKELKDEELALDD